MDEVTSPIFDESTGLRAVIGSMPRMSSDDAIEAVRAAAAAWDKGQGAWPQMKLIDRIAAVEATVAELRAIRSDIVEALVWEIAKTSGDAGTSTQGGAQNISFPAC
jgi:glyceraldehyde-3-phosphate dehydrogenase (NADP+)